MLPSLLASEVALMTYILISLFCSMYNNIVPPSQLPQKANYYLFKAGFLWL